MISCPWNRGSKCCGSLRITKILQKKQWKFVVSLLTAKSKIRFSKFRYADTWSRDEPRISCSSEFSQDTLRVFVECKSIQELGLNTYQSVATWKRVKKVSKLDVWVPHNLTKNKGGHIFIETNLSRLRNNQFLKNINTGKEKWGFQTILNQKAVDWQGWISATYPQSYAICTIGLQ